VATSTLVPLSEYLKTSYEPDREWVDGEVRERNVGDRTHAALQRFFLKFFFAIEQEYGLLSYPELRTQVSSTNCRVPDVLILRETDPFDSVVTTPPVLCIEILSPDDRMSEMHEKIEEYLKMGVAAVWVVDPRRRTALFADTNGTRPTEVLEVPGTDIRVSVREAFVELDKLEARTGK
jgi:Uma2 family endonuclease